MYAKFGYDAKMEGYTTLTLDMNELGEIMGEIYKRVEGIGDIKISDKPR